MAAGESGGIFTNLSYLEYAYIQLGRYRDGQHTVDIIATHIGSCLTRRQPGYAGVAVAALFEVVTKLLTAAIRERLTAP